MAMNQTTQSILERVHELSGRPVVVQPDPTVRQATLKLARGSAAVHVVAYNPTLGAEADYAICFQCGFALRVFLAPENARFDLRTSSHGRKEAESLSVQHFEKVGLAIPAPMRSQLLAQFIDGLILQLRSMPISLRVDAWLRHDFPEFIDHQRAANIRQLNENATCLRPDVSKLTPPRILHANVAMNAAFAAYWSRTWADPLVIVPYKTSANLADGQSLLKLWDEIPDDPANDRQLIEAWGDYLKLNGWYDFVPYS
jgi:hypothetical protein